MALTLRLSMLLVGQVHGAPLVPQIESAIAPETPLEADEGDPGGVEFSTRAHRWHSTQFGGVRGDHVP